MFVSPVARISSICSLIRSVILLTDLPHDILSIHYVQTGAVVPAHQETPRMMDADDACDYTSSDAAEPHQEIISMLLARLRLF